MPNDDLYNFLKCQKVSTLKSLATFAGFTGKLSELKLTVPMVVAIYNFLIGEGDDPVSKLAELQQLAKENSMTCKSPPSAIVDQAEVDDDDDDDDDEGEQSLRDIIQQIAQSPKHEIVRLLTELVYELCFDRKA